jgi:hypothetical protein
MSDQDDMPSTRENVRRLVDPNPRDQKDDEDAEHTYEEIRARLAEDRKRLGIPDDDAYREYQQKADTEAPPNSTKADSKNSKGDKEDRLIQNYISHLNFILTWGDYDDFLESKEIIKMAQIKSHMGLSKHPSIVEVMALYDNVIKIIRKYHPSNIERWIKAVNDEIADSKARNNQNALTCPILSWSDHGSDGKAKPPILRAIIALRTLLEEGTAAQK